MKKLIIPMILLGAFACANEPETEMAEAEPVTTDTMATNTAMTDTTAAQNDWWAYNNWDADANQQVARTEFDQRMQSGFAEWDVDGDGALGRDEAADTFWDWFDGNDDNIIDSEEWNTGTERWGVEGVNWGTYDTWDADANQQLTETEWRGGWNEDFWSGWSWDTSGDGAWGVDEASDNFWDFFDGNNDDIVDAGEWGYQD